MDGLTERSGIVLALCGALGGWLFGGPEGAVLAAMVGFFLGQSLRSVVRTFAIGR